MQHRKVTTHDVGPMARTHEGAEALRRDPEHFEIEVVRRVPEGGVADTSSSEECTTPERCYVLT
jgi:hypothetical protein